jgi:hypothetical protein
VGIDAEPKPLTLDTELPDGTYYYIISIDDCQVLKHGHFECSKKKGKTRVRHRYDCRQQPPCLAPHAIGKWSMDTIKLHALISNVKHADEEAFQVQLRELGKGSGS